MSKKKIKASEPHNCKHCGVSLIGPPIPKQHHKYYGGNQFFKREIGIYDERLDRTVDLKCPDCKRSLWNE